MAAPSWAAGACPGPPWGSQHGVRPAIAPARPPGITQPGRHRHGPRSAGPQAAFPASRHSSPDPVTAFTRLLNSSCSWGNSSRVKNTEPLLRGASAVAASLYSAMTWPSFMPLLPRMCIASAQTCGCVGGREGWDCISPAAGRSRLPGKHRPCERGAAAHPRRVFKARATPSATGGKHTCLESHSLLSQTPSDGLTCHDHHVIRPGLAHHVALKQLLVERDHALRGLGLQLEQVVHLEDGRGVEMGKGAPCGRALGMAGAPPRPWASCYTLPRWACRPSFLATSCRHGPITPWNQHRMTWTERQGRLRRAGVAGGPPPSDPDGRPSPPGPQHVLHATGK